MTKGDNLETINTRTGIFQGVLGMVLFWQIFNLQIGHLGIKIRG
jgi:hypothetical protein